MHADSPRAGHDLDGIYIALGPLGAALYNPTDGWNGGFGGEISLTRVREQHPLAAIGVSVGGIRFSQRAAGRLWFDVSAATRRALNIAIGVSAGPTVEVDDETVPRFGAQASVWVFAGVIPYVRVGRVQRSGNFVEFGLRVALPALRW